MSEILDKARAHFSKRKHLDVPEWESTIYWTAINAPEREKIARMAKHAGGSDSDFDLRVLIEKAEDAEGKKLFDIGDLPILTSSVDMLVASRIARAMTSTLSAEQAEKN